MKRLQRLIADNGAGMTDQLAFVDIEDETHLFTVIYEIYNFCHLLLSLFKASMVKLVSLYCARVINVAD